MALFSTQTTEQRTLACFLDVPDAPAFVARPLTTVVIAMVQAQTIHTPEIWLNYFSKGLISTELEARIGRLASLVLQLLGHGCIYTRKWLETNRVLSLGPLRQILLKKSIYVFHRVTQDLLLLALF